MTDVLTDAAGPEGPGRRRAPRTRRHTVARVLGTTLLALAMVTGLSGVYLYRHLNENLTVLDVAKQLTDRPEKMPSPLPEEPLNILVMGSDARDGKGNNIDGLTGDGARSDTTILFHLSADREDAYGVSIPRDSLVDRPECTGKDGETIPAETDTIWNEAFEVGGPACTIQQFEQTTGVFIDNFVVVDFAGFRGMVDAIDGVEVCIPEDIEEPSRGINIPAGTREIRGKDALDYVRVRYSLGDGSDIGRIKRQQAFVAAMAAKVVSGGTLARFDRLVGFLDAATKSLIVDEGMGNIFRLGRLGLGFQNIGLDNIKFVTVPFEFSSEQPGRVVWTPEAEGIWKKVINDEPLSKAQLGGGVITAGDDVDGAAPSPSPGSPSASPSESPSEDSTDVPGSEADEGKTEAREEAGLCA